MSIVFIGVFFNFDNFKQGTINNLMLANLGWVFTWVQD